MDPTLYYNEFIKIFLGSVRCNSYLELGLDNGANFSIASSVVPHCVGVDKTIHKDLKTFKKEDVVHECTTDQFFAKNKETFDVIFIDACHEFRQVAIDFTNSVKILNPSGFIFLHDTDPEAEFLLAPRFCNDAYKMVHFVRSLRAFDILTLPLTNAGMSIVSRKGNRRVLSFVKE